MWSKSGALASALFILVSAGSAQASNYGLTLNDAGGQTGTGTFTINGSVPDSGTSIFTAGSGLTSLSFSIDGYNFSLANEQLFNPYVTFTNGTLTNIAYLGSLNGFELELGTVGLNYIFADFANLSNSIGSISAVATTPLPAGLPLFITGLAALVMLGRRRKQSLQAA